jgi:shikimate kinase
MSAGSGPVRAIVLVGFMAAGKSTVGRALATRLGWRFIDFDEEIERRDGMTVAEIFRARGEGAFRAREADLTRELSSYDRVVIAPGGGWITRENALAELSGRAWVVWLRIGAEEAVRRAQASGTVRPLLADGDPLDTATRLLAARDPLYRQAHAAIDVEGRDTEDIVTELLNGIPSMD